MKKLMTAIALVALAGTPALAHDYYRSSANDSARVADQAYAPGYSGYGYDAYASADRSAMSYAAPAQYPYWDPDPGIRYELRRESPLGANTP